MNKAWFVNIPRLVTIAIAIALYCVAFWAFIKKRKVFVRPANTVVDPASITYSGEERRIYPRARCGIEVRYKPDGVKGCINVFREGKARDIAEGGLFLESPDKFSVNDRLELKLKIPSVGHFMLMRGVVVWVKEVDPGKWFNNGISITDIDPNDRKQIAKYVAGVNPEDKV